MPADGSPTIKSSRDGLGACVCFGEKIVSTRTPHNVFFRYGACPLPSLLSNNCPPTATFCRLYAPFCCLYVPFCCVCVPCSCLHVPCSCPVSMCRLAVRMSHLAVMCEKIYVRHLAAHLTTQCGLTFFCYETMLFFCVTPGMKVYVRHLAAHLTTKYGWRMVAKSWRGIGSRLTTRR